MFAIIKGIEAVTLPIQEDTVSIHQGISLLDESLMLDVVSKTLQGFSTS
jgi:hypothetical protein